MITVATHKHHKSPSKHSKTTYVFTSGRVIVTVQIQSRKDGFKGAKMTTAKWTSIEEPSRIYPIVLQDLSKRGVCRCWVKMLQAVLSMWPCKNISQIQALLIYLFFPTQTQKTKTGTAKLQIGGRLLIASIRNREHQVISYLLHSTPTGGKLWCAFYQPQQIVQKCWAKSVLLSQTGMFLLFFIQFQFAGFKHCTYWALQELLEEHINPHNPIPIFITSNITWGKNSSTLQGPRHHGTNGIWWQVGCGV